MISHCHNNQAYMNYSANLEEDRCTKFWEATLIFSLEVGRHQFMQQVLKAWSHSNNYAYWFMMWFKAGAALICCVIIQDCLLQCCFKYTFSLVVNRPAQFIACLLDTLCMTSSVTLHISGNINVLFKWKSKVSWAKCPLVKMGWCPYVLMPTL